MGDLYGAMCMVSEVPWFFVRVYPEEMGFRMSHHFDNQQISLLINISFFLNVKF